jgi:hypothetical protein
MGAASPQQIDVNFHINVGVNGEKSKTIKASIDKNNPSAFINISTLNSETTDIETSQISQTNQNDRISQVSQTNPNVKDSHNFENNGNNVDPAPPMSMASSQQFFINTSTNEQFNINHGGDNRNQNENQTKNDTTQNKVDIDNNIREHKRVDENETPYSKPINTAEYGYLDGKDSDDLSFSRKFYVGDIKDINDINSKKEMINQKVKEGYFPLFIQLDEEKPLFLFINNYETMQNVLEEYKNLKGINDSNKEYTLYNQKTKEEIPQNKPIKDLGLNYFTFISNNK